MMRRIIITRNRNMKSQHSYPIFTPRKNDFTFGGNKSLIKDHTLFSPTNGLRVGILDNWNTTHPDLGPHRKVKNSPDKTSVYYFIRRGYNEMHIEYFAFEILNYIGVNTPKCRFSTFKRSDYISYDQVLASKAIPELMPMCVFDDRRSLLSGYCSPNKETLKQLLSWNQRYKLDIQKQIIIDTVENRQCRISGHLFCTDIAALLVDDCDFQATGFNLGVTRVGNRFFTIAIDKARASYQGKTYQELASPPSQTYYNVVTEALYKFRMNEQALAFVYKVYLGLQIKNGLCDFDRIFSFQRCVNSGMPVEQSQVWCQNLKRTASSFVEHYKNIYGADCFEAFAEREKLRDMFARQMQKELFFDDDYLPILVEDLRAPYYQSLYANQISFSQSDLNNRNLIEAVKADLVIEFSATCSETVTIRYHLSN